MNKDNEQEMMGLLRKMVDLQDKQIRILKNIESSLE